MIVVDMESTGLDPEKNSLLSVAAIDFNNPDYQFYEECRVWDGAHIEDEALLVNGFTREQATDPKKKTDREVVLDFLRWLERCEEHTIAGQNPYVDHDFLRATAHRYHINWPLAHRIVDLHSIAWFHQVRRGLMPPVHNKHSDLGLETILEYVGVPIKRKAHNALEDAKLEAEAFSRLINEKPLFGEFKGFPITWLKK